MATAKKLPARAQTAVLQNLSQEPAALLIGMGARTFRSSDAPRNGDGTYSGPALVQWAIAKATASTSDDPLLASGDSPNLERYRAAKADLAEMDAQLRRGQLVEHEAFLEWFSSEIAAPIRRAIETLQQRHGAEAAAIIVAALERAETAIERKAGTDADSPTA